MAAIIRIPDKDEEFNTFVNDIHTYLNTTPPGGSSNFDRLGIEASLQTLFNDNYALWAANWTKYTSPLTQTPNVIHKKDNYRDDLEPNIRAIQNKAEQSQNLTQDDRDMLRVHEPDEQTDIPAPTVDPNLTIDKREHKRVIIRVHNPVDPDTKAKPEGVATVEFYQWIGGINANPPANPATWQHVGGTGRFLFPINYTDEDLGKRAHIAARYRNAKGESGPFSEVEDVVVS